MKKKILIAVLVLVVLGGGVFFFMSSGEEEVARQEEENRQVEQAEERTLDTVGVYGIVKADEKRNVRLDIPARVEALHIKEGERVEKGDKLFTLNLEEARAELTEKRQSLEQAKTELELFVDQFELKIDRLKSQLRAAEKSYYRYQEKLERKQKLLEQEAAAKEEVEDLEAQLEQKKEEVRSIEFDLKEARLERGQDYKEIQAEVARLENQVGKLARELEADYLAGDNLVADVETGVVYDVEYQSGDFVNKEQPLLRMISTEELIVEAEVPEEFIKDISLGDQATIAPLADRDREYQGEVVRIANKAVDKEAETIVPIEVSISDQDKFLLPNFNVDVTIEIE